MLHDRMRGGASSSTALARASFTQGGRREEEDEPGAGRNEELYAIRGMTITPKEEVGVSSFLLLLWLPETSTLSGEQAAPGVSTLMLAARSDETPETSGTTERSLGATAEDRVQDVSITMLPTRSMDTLELVGVEGTDGAEMEDGARAAHEGGVRRAESGRAQGTVVTL